MKRVVITGGAGFIGSNLVAHFNALHPEVRIVVVDDLSTGNLDNLRNTSCEFIQQSILNYDGLNVAFKGADAVIHLGALGSVPRSIEDPVATHEANVTGTLMVLEACRQNGIQQVVFASSSSVYGGNHSKLKRETDWVAPISPYGASKLAAESYVLSHQASYKLKALAFRFFNVYGPLQADDHPYAAVIPRFISAAVHGHPLTIHGDGNQSRDFTYVDSVCSAIRLAVVDQISHTSPVNLAFGTNTTLKELVKKIEKEVKKPLTLRFSPAREGDVLRSQADSTLLKRLFPTLVSIDLEEGIKSTLDWFQSRNLRQQV